MALKRRIVIVDNSPIIFKVFLTSLYLCYSQIFCFVDLHSTKHKAMTTKGLLSKG